MSDSEPQKVTMADLIAAQTFDGISANGETCDGKLLRDMLAEYPSLRVHVLGGRAGDLKTPPGTLTLSRRSRQCFLRLHKPTFGYQCQFSGDSFFGLLELAEECLRSGGANWEPDYQEAKKEKREWLRK